MNAYRNTPILIWGFNNGNKQYSKYPQGNINGRAWEESENGRVIRRYDQHRMNSRKREVVLYNSAARFYVLLTKNTEWWALAGDDYKIGSRGHWQRGGQWF